MIIVIGSIEATPEGRAEILRLSLEHVQRSRAEPGCIDHRVSVDCENERRFVFVEYWADMDALKTHFAVSASGDFVRKASALAASEPEIKIFEADEARPG
ncbi:MAG: putative quinol monooxygenase [Pseudomonadota bacterium]